MKTLIKLFVSFTIIGLIIISCKKEKELFKTSDDNNIESQTRMEANIDSIFWEANNPYAVISNGKITITGVSADSQMIVITINAISTGTYTLDQNSDSKADYYATMTALTSYSSSTNAQSGGEVIISSINETDSLISGSFNFKLYDYLNDSVIVSEGIFENIKYIPLPDNSLSVDINDTSFTATTITVTQGLGPIISGTDGSKTVSLTFTSSNLEADGVYSMPTNCIGMYNSMFSISGSSTITSLDSIYNRFNNSYFIRIQGTFDFEASIFITNASLTNGNFDITY